MSDLPQDFAGALKNAGLAAFFADCTNAHRGEYLKWIAGAKRPETRKARIEKAVKMIAEKRAEEAARTKKIA
ncbi:MAG TPA: YdeI/OmpD-associated family protein [Verrucomicrobiae bacterium]|nr:YdeI/OmpD-associated family protein [Verrucomicrobiae bacterium]